MNRMKPIGCGNRQVRQRPNLSSSEAFRRVSLPRDWPEGRRKQPGIFEHLKNPCQLRTSWWWRQDSNLKPTAMSRWLGPIEPQVRREMGRELKFARYVTCPVSSERPVVREPQGSPPGGVAIGPWPSFQLHRVSPCSGRWRVSASGLLMLMTRKT